LYRVLFWSWLLLAKLGTLVLLILLVCVATLEYCVRLLGNWVLGAAIAAGLWDAAEAAGLLGIGCR
jgi:hypothetical protein